jgi:hypothetical protein
MEGDIEQRLREKFTLIDKSDPAAIAAAQQVLYRSAIVRHLSLLDVFVKRPTIGTFGLLQKRIFCCLMINYNFISFSVLLSYIFKKK